MTLTTEYHTRMVAPEQSPHTSEEPHVLQRGESIPVTEQEEEAWLDKMQKLAGCVA